MEKNSQTILVLDEQGMAIGHTYPKRAKGLVKKCRAEFVSDREIRLCRQCPTHENVEDKEMDKIHYITVNPAEWYKSPNGGSKTVYDQFVISNPLADEIPSAEKMTEVLSVGAWDWNSGSCVTNGFQELTPGEEYHFVFWLNGGENDRGDETCRLRILFLDRAITPEGMDFPMKELRYRLNRGYIKPLKKFRGWEYYDIPFKAQNTRYTQFQFVADRAPMALMAAEPPEAYRELKDEPDPFEADRPQRHNIIFEDGWPVDKWYSTKKLARKKLARYAGAAGGASGTGCEAAERGGAEGYQKDISKDFEDMVLKQVEKAMEGRPLMEMVTGTVKGAMEGLSPGDRIPGTLKEAYGDAAKGFW